MSEDFTDLLLYGFSEMISGQKSVGSILSCNDKTEKYALSLTEEQARELLATRSYMLKETDRIEFQSGTIEKIIKEFCDSPYIDQKNYEQTLHSLIEIFYTLKDITNDILSDDEAITFMKKSFNGICGGSLAALESDCLPQLERHLNQGKKYSSFKIGT